MQTTQEVITPSMARDWLANFNPPGNNRNFRPGWAAELAGYITNGHFYLTHQGIAFGTDNMLVDGQHRLAAIVEANIPVQMNVTRGVAITARPYIDMNRRRTVADALKIEGVEATPAHVATATMMLVAGRGFGFGRGSRPGRDTIMAYFSKHFEAIHFTMQVNAKAISNASIRAPIARAYYNQDRQRLKEFIQVLNSGMPIIPDDDSAAVLLRNWCFSRQQAGNSAGARNDRPDSYYRASTALLHFLNRNKVIQLRPMQREQFPMPDDEVHNDGTGFREST